MTSPRANTIYMSITFP